MLEYFRHIHESCLKNSFLLGFCNILEAFDTAAGASNSVLLSSSWLSLPVALVIFSLNHDQPWGSLPKCYRGCK
jgi:hypothetical protein